MRAGKVRSLLGKKESWQSMIGQKFKYLLHRLAGNVNFQIQKWIEHLEESVSKNI